MAKSMTGRWMMMNTGKTLHKEQGEGFSLQSKRYIFCRTF